MGERKMKISRQFVLGALIQLDNDCGNDNGPEYYESMTDEQLMEEYCLSGLFAQIHPDAYEEDLEGLE
jgi:hypothetical protein